LPGRAAYSCEDRTSPSAGGAASRPANRWRDGEGIAPAATDPLTQAISKLTDVADRQLSLLAPVASPTTIHQLAAAPALEVDRSTASGEPRDPPSATLAQMVSTAPLFSQLVDEYLAMRASACAEPGAVSTMRLRAGIFLAVMGDPRSIATSRKISRTT